MLARTSIFRLAARLDLIAFAQSEKKRVPPAAAGAVGALQGGLIGTFIAPGADSKLRSAHASAVGNLDIAKRVEALKGMQGEPAGAFRPEPAKNFTPFQKGALSQSEKLARQAGELERRVLKSAGKRRLIGGLAGAALLGGASYITARKQELSALKLGELKFARGDFFAKALLRHPGQVLTAGHGSQMAITNAARANKGYYLVGAKIAGSGASMQQTRDHLATQVRSMRGRGLLRGNRQTPVPSTSEGLDAALNKKLFKSRLSAGLAGAAYTGRDNASTFGGLEPGMIAFDRTRDGMGQFAPQTEAGADPGTMQAAYGGGNLQAPTESTSGLGKKVGAVAATGGTMAAALLLARKLRGRR